MGRIVRYRGSAPDDMTRDFEKLYRESYPIVYSYVRSRTDDAVAEDIVSEAFLKAARAFGSYDPARAKFTTWVIAIAMNCLVSYYRKQRPTAEIDSVPEGTLAVPGGQDAVDDKMLADVLLSCLDPDERELVLMKYRDGMRNVEIAEATSVNASTVASRVSRARLKMRAAAARCGYTPAGG